MAARKKPVATPREKSLEAQNNLACSGWQGRLKKMMVVRNMSQRRLGAEAGLGNAAVNFMVNRGNTTELDTLRRLANVLNVPVVWLATGAPSVIGPVPDDPDLGTIRYMPVFTSVDVEREKPVEDNGAIALTSGRHLMQAKALIISDVSMQNEGTNQPVPPQKVVCESDIVVFAVGMKPEIGELVVARSPRGAVCRLLVQNERGELQLVANNAAFARTTVKESDILGPVIGLHRTLKRR